MNFRSGASRTYIVTLGSRNAVQLAPSAVPPAGSDEDEMYVKVVERLQIQRQLSTDIIELIGDKY